MELKTLYSQDASGNVVPSPRVYVYLADTTTLALLQDRTGQTLLNPFYGTQQGLIEFRAPDGEYDVRILGAGKTVVLRVRCVDIFSQINEANTAVVSAAASANSAELSASLAQASVVDASAHSDHAEASATLASSYAGQALDSARASDSSADMARASQEAAHLSDTSAASSSASAAISATTASQMAATASLKADQVEIKVLESQGYASSALAYSQTASSKALDATAAALTAQNSALSSSNSAASSEASKVSSQQAASASQVSAASAAASETNAQYYSQQTAQDRLKTADDRQATAADRAQTELDRQATAADRAQTELDRQATAADRAQTELDRQATAADRAQTGLDRTQTGLDRVQTGSDRVASSNSAAASASYAAASLLSANNSQSSASASASYATAASTSAGQASGSAAQALAIYQNTSAMQSALSQAASQVSLAAGYAASASSAVQQDLSGVNAAALHRSPNAVTAMFVYDTSKDSDGGAWTEKCQHTSWYNEPINGKWLGAQRDEIWARFSIGTLGTAIEKSSSGWYYVSAAFKYVKISFDVKGDGVNTASIYCPSSSYPNNGTVWSAVATTDWQSYYLYVFINSGADTRIVQNGTNITWRNFTVQEAYFGASISEYYQSTIDGRFYALNKNLLTSTATLQTQTQWLSVGTYTFSSTTASTGSVAISGAATATHTAGGVATTFVVTASGNVTFTVTGSVTTAQCELGSVATTYQANTSTTRYTEVFRGNKREFPKLSAIVAEASNVTIYDLTEPGRPMWMRFASFSSIGSSFFNWFSAALPTITSTSALNGILSISEGIQDGLFLISFAKDNCTIAYSNLNISLKKSKISDRVSAGNGYFMGGGISGLPHLYINSVAMTVLPDAPVDPVTGLQVPTIAVATNGGVSIIKHNGTVVSGSSGAFRNVNITSSLLSAAKADATWYYALSPGSLGASFTLSTATGEFGRGNTAVLKNANRTELVRSSGALVTRRENNLTNSTNSINATLTNTFNTGHMVGDIRRTYLSDISIGAINGDTIQLITPSSKDTNWTDNGNGIFTTTGGYGALTFTSPIFKLGKVFTITFTLVRNANSLLASNKATGVWDISLGSSGTFTYTLPIYNSESFTFYGNGLNGTLSDIYVTEKIPDRSYKASSATINGSLTKSPVATGSQLVAYSGFSA